VWEARALQRDQSEAVADGFENAEALLAEGLDVVVRIVERVRLAA